MTEDIRFYSKEKAAFCVSKNQLVIEGIKANLWINQEDKTVTYKNHWWSRKRVLQGSDTLDKNGFIKRGLESMPFIMKSYDKNMLGLCIKDLKDFLGI